MNRSPSSTNKPRTDSVKQSSKPILSPTYRHSGRLMSVRARIVSPSAMPVKSPAKSWFREYQGHEEPQTGTGTIKGQNH